MTTVEIPLALLCGVAAMLVAVGLVVGVWVAWNARLDRLEGKAVTDINEETPCERSARRCTACDDEPWNQLQGTNQALFQ